MVESVNGHAEAPRRRGRRGSRRRRAACRVMPVGARATGMATSMPIIFVLRRARLDVDRDALAQLDLLEVGLVGAVGALGPRAGIGVVVEHARHLALASSLRSSIWVMTGALMESMLRRPGRGRRRGEHEVVPARSARAPAAAPGVATPATSSLTFLSADARTPSRRSRRARSTRFRHWPAARRISRPSRVCAGRVRARVAILKSSKRSLMPMVLAA